MNKAVFLDRDGTIIQEKGFLQNPEEVTLISGAELALHRLQTAGFFLFIVSNQSGVGRGYFTAEAVQRVNQRLLQELARFNVSFQKIYIAPEAPGTPSYGRKPSPQFLFDARDEFELDLTQSYLIGDKLSDIQCGWNAGVKTSILVRTGYGSETEPSTAGLSRVPVIVETLTQAADWILKLP
jgi:D-glycero-D-manno-heptose 1,7-bisphosphate phosphatase